MDNRIVEYFNGITKLDEYNYKEMVLKFGEDAVLKFLNYNVEKVMNSKDLTDSDREAMFLKLDYYISNDLLSFSNEDIKFSGVGDAYEEYIKDVCRYKLLTDDEEKKYGNDLKLISNVDLLVNKNIDGKELFVIDLEKVFASISNVLDRDYVLDKLYSYYNVVDNNKVVLYYLDKYKGISNEEIPSIKKLNDCFSQDDIFNKFDSKNKLDSLELRRQIDDSVTYLTARNKMINHNLKLVIHVARKYSGMDIIDLIGEGNIGLVRAVEKFDIDKGYKFSTYAIWWIRQAITRALAERSGNIRIPSYYHYKYSRFKQLVDKLNKKYGRNLTMLELSNETGLTSQEIVSLLNYNINVVSLDTFVNDDGESTLGDFIPDESVDIEKDCLNDVMFSEVVHVMDDVLTDREKMVLFNRFGVNSGRGMSLQEIGNEIGVTKERVRQIEEKAFNKVRVRLKKKDFLDYYI